jgi:hypothetical protein
MQDCSGKTPVARGRPQKFPRFQPLRARNSEPACRTHSKFCAFSTRLSRSFVRTSSLVARELATAASARLLREYNAGVSARSNFLLERGLPCPFHTVLGVVLQKYFSLPPAKLDTGPLGCAAGRAARYKAVSSGRRRSLATDAIQEWNAGSIPRPRWSGRLFARSRICS